MEHSLVSRRVSWSCAAAVEVAPGWPLGLPPPRALYFMCPHHVRIYVRALRDYYDANPPNYCRWTGSGMMKISDVYLIHSAWHRLFDYNFFIWDNFRYRGFTHDVDRYNRNRNWRLLFYNDIYDDIVRELLQRIVK